jgi:hypothetical protein
MKFKYFRSVEGHVVDRYGTDRSIGVARVEGQHVWDTERVVAIPETEYLRHLKAYRRAVKSGALKVSTKAAYDKQNKAQEGETDKNPEKKDKPKKGGAGRSPKKANKGG